MQLELSFEDLPSQPLLATQRRCLLGNIRQFQGSTIVKTSGRASSFLGLQSLAQQATYIPPLGETVFNARHPSESIFPPLLT